MMVSRAAIEISQRTIHTAARLQEIINACQGNVELAEKLLEVDAAGGIPRFLPGNRDGTIETAYALIAMINHDE